jgi:hypothetical protein
MPVWPKSFYTFGVSLRTAATEWKLRHRRTAVATQQRAWRDLLPRLAAARFWQEAGVETGMSYEQYQQRVPLQTPESLAPAIAKMHAGTTDVLWPGRCAVFARTAGTSTGTPRLVPVTEEMLGHFRRAGYDAALYYTVRARHAGAFRGRHLLFGSPPVLTPTRDRAETFVGDISGIAALNLPRWAERHLYEPGASVAALPDWNARLEAIATRSCPRDITLLGGYPSWLITLADLLRKRCSDGKVVTPTLQAVWPNLECCVHTGLVATPYLPQLRAALGSGVTLHEVYAATEACIATQDAESRDGLRLMADMGIFFEFVPLADFDSLPFEQLGARAVPLSGVVAGVPYVLVLTTPGGLARYVLGDIARFTTTDPHRIVYLGGTLQRLNTFGEQVLERDLCEALATVCQRRDWSIVNFHVAPLFAASPTGQRRGRHEWWVELKPGTVATPTGPQMAAELDQELQRANDAYAGRRAAGSLEAPFVRLVMPGVFEHWLRFHGRWGDQHKVPRCRGDRAVADELAKITNFAVD